VDAEPDQPSPGPGSEDDDVLWPVDAALGAAARVLRIAGGFGRAVASAPPTQAAIDVVRSVTRPLAEEGQRIREGSEEEGSPGIAAVARDLTPAIVDVVDVDAIVDQVDVDALIPRVDVDAIIKRVDVDAIIKRVDVDAIISRVDVDAIIQRVDINAIVQRVDMEDLMTQTELGSIIAESTSGVASQLLDTVRSQGVGLDGFVSKWANRLVRRDPSALPSGPPLLVDPPRALPSGGNS